MLPWKDVYAALSKIFTLTQETQKNKADIKAVGEKVDGLSDDIQALHEKTNDLALAFQRCFYETQRLHDELQHLREDNHRLRDEAQHREADAAREHENLLLRLENHMLRFERRLPPPQTDDAAEEQPRPAPASPSCRLECWSWDDDSRCEILSPQEVALRVRPYVTGRHIGDIALRVDDARIHLRNGYWNIPIRPSRWPDPLFPYYEALAEFEDEVQEKDGLIITSASGEPV